MRTEKSIKNILVALVSYVTTLIIGFLARSFFLKILIKFLFSNLKLTILLIIKKLPSIENRIVVSNKMLFHKIYLLFNFN